MIWTYNHNPWLGWRRVNRWTVEDAMGAFHPFKLFTYVSREDRENHSDNGTRRLAYVIL